MKQIKIGLVVHNVRSALNVGSLLRTADGLGVGRVYLTGYSPYPEVKGDVRLPHVRLRATNQIHKTALGAEDSVAWSHHENLEILVRQLKKDGFTVAALEQTKISGKLTDFKALSDIVLIVGNEVEGLDDKVLKLADISLEIPMLGSKESLNVSVAGAIALYQIRFGA